MDNSEIALNIAYILYAFGLVYREMLKLRCFLLASNLGFLVFSLLILNTSLIIWNIVFITINVYSIVVLLIEKAPTILDEKQESIYQKTFNMLSRTEFLKI